MNNETSLAATGRVDRSVSRNEQENGMGEFEVGMEVEWASSSNGTTKTKCGRVEAVIKKGERPNAEQRREADAYGYGRDHESYMVRVPGKTESSKGKLYWPRVSALRHVPANADVTGLPQAGEGRS